MERILTVKDMRSADEFTINKLGISEKELILRAGSAVADEIIKRLRGGRVLVCIGKGNNGEDGRVIADILSKTHGFTVASISVANGIFKLFDREFDIIVDCIFGTGLDREVEGRYKEAIDRINSSGAYIVSCDIPSGLNGDTGLVMGTAVKANLTVAIQEYKLGHFLNDGPDYSGKVIAKDIGISIWGEGYVKKITSSEAGKLFAKRKRNINKGMLGKSAVIGGSKDYPGSVVLSHSALVALKMGIGYSAICVPDSIYNAVATIHPECIITSTLTDGNAMLFDKEKLDRFLSYDAISIGMGLGIGEEQYKILQYLLENFRGNLVIDADGLNTLSKFGVEILKNAKCKVVLTPHIKEFSRLVNKEVGEILQNQIALAKEFAKEYKVALILKSATTIITDGEEVYLNTTGCSGMAKGGSGDLLSGILSGLLAREKDAFYCAVVACYLFGKAGELAQKKGSEFTLTPSDIIGVLPEVINSLE